MIYLDLPTINGSGTTEQQLAEIRLYIYRSNEQMNATLSNLSIDKIWENTASALSAANSGNQDEEKALMTQYQKIRDLVIKTADVVIKQDESLQMAMNGSYLAKSDFGEYLLNTSVEIDGNSTGFKQLYTHETQLSSDYGNYKTYQQNFIKEGLLDDTGATAIYGIEVGLLTSEFTVVDEDGKEKVIEVDSHKKLRVTPTELSLFDNDIKVAYITDGAIYFPKANITGGSIDIGGGNFKVDSSGNMTAKSGTFSGTLSADSLITTFNSYTCGVLKLTDNKMISYEPDEDGGYKSCEYGGMVQSYFNDSEFKIATFGKHKSSEYNTTGIATMLYEHHGGYNILNSHLFRQKDSVYINYDLVWTYGSDSTYITHNIYDEEGLHFNTPVILRDKVKVKVYNPYTAHYSSTITNWNVAVGDKRLVFVNGLLVEINDI